MYALLISYWPCKQFRKPKWFSLRLHNKSSPFCHVYPQNGNRTVTIDSVTSLHPMYMCAYAELVAALFDRGSGRVSAYKPAVGSSQDAGRPVSLLYAHLAQREEDPLWPGTLRLLLLPANPPQKPQSADATAAVFPVRTEGHAPQKRLNRSKCRLGCWLWWSLGWPTGIRWRPDPTAEGTLFRGITKDTPRTQQPAATLDVPLAETSHEEDHVNLPAPPENHVTTSWVYSEPPLSYYLIHCGGGCMTENWLTDSGNFSGYLLLYPNCWQ